MVEGWEWVQKWFKWNTISKQKAHSYPAIPDADRAVQYNSYSNTMILKGNYVVLAIGEHLKPVTPPTRPLSETSKKIKNRQRGGDGKT